MSSISSRLKSTDSLAQWAEKLNTLMTSVEGFLNSGGAFSSTSPTASDLIVFDGGWKNKTLIGEILIDTSYSNSSLFKYKLDTSVITDKTASTSPDVANDYLLIYDSGSSTLKKIAPRYIATPGGSPGQVQYNLNGISFMGATGFTFDGTRLSSPALAVKTNLLYSDSANSRIGINNSSPSYDLDITGSANISGSYRIGGSQVLTSTSLGSGITSSSLTSLGTVTSLSAGSGSFSGGVSALSFSSSTFLNTNGNVGVGGTLGATGAVSFGSTLNVASGAGFGGSVGVGGTLGATGAVTFGSTLNVGGAAGFSSSVAVTGVLTGRTSTAYQTSSVGLVAQTTYIVASTGITLTLPASPTSGDKISFIPADSTINNFTVARNGNNIMNLSSDLDIDVAAPFDLIYNSSAGWVLG